MDDNRCSVKSESGVTGRTMVGLAATLTVCLVVIARGQGLAIRPELMGGPWEVASPSGVDGIFVKINTHAQGPFERQTITSQTVVLRVYHRKDDHETFGWYVVSPPADATVAFDGRSLRVVGLTATFEQNPARWIGTWLFAGQTRDVVLERPRPATGVTPSPLCGDWEGLPEPTRGMASTRLYIVQSSDGLLTAWMDRVIGVVDQRSGEPLRVVSADPTSVILELESAGGPQYRFNGAISADGNTVTGHWNGLNARENFRRIP
jgi:hypothetical protein